uniref:Uncharacterized protein LOC100368455 n=1 Tax=Saccoglossus kowalevskii TaxID=10224 RepID=A0ABM0LTM0_SACKO|nr:PREDICTED: uncharacterized protein LOC100368455 [Saccoglossus kowalevskii]
MWSSLPKQPLPMYHLPYLRRSGEGYCPVAPPNYYSPTRPVGAIHVRGLPRKDFTPPLPPPTPRLPSILPRRKPTHLRHGIGSDLEWDDFEFCADDFSDSPDGSDNESTQSVSTCSHSELEWDDFDLRNSGDEAADVDESLAMDNLYPLLNSLTSRPIGRRGVPLGAVQVRKLPRITCTFAGLAHVPEEFCYDISSRSLNKDLLTLTSKLNGYDSDIWDYDDDFQTTKLGKTFSNESLNSDISTVSTQESGYRSSGTAKSRDTPDLPNELTDSSLAESYGDGSIVEYYDHFADYNYFYKLSPHCLDSPLSASLTDLSDATLCEFNETANLLLKPERSASMETLRSELQTSPSNSHSPTKIPRTENNCVVCEKHSAARCEVSAHSPLLTLHELVDDSGTVHLDPDTLSACYHSNQKLQPINYDIPADELLTAGDSPPPLHYYGNHDIGELIEGHSASDQYPLSIRFAANQKGKRSVKKRKRKAYDKVDDDVAEETEEDKKSKRLAPNYFVAIQVSNPEIHKNLRNVQLAVMQSDEKLKDAMIPIPTLHLTVMVMHIANDEELERGFKPHLTVMKLSRAPSLRRKGVRRIKSEYYRSFNSEYFGSQIVKGLQLCSINKPKLDDGYYWRADEIYFDAGKDEGDRLETVTMTRMMINDIIEEAIDQVETVKNDEVVMEPEEPEEKENKVVIAAVSNQSKARIPVQPTENQDETN